ncbi:short-chain alcohol dehydrogenase like protein [Arthrobacter sp. PAMC 25486]|uniref:SDR family oxidoreductase n=1 Tax=Arthrobacter sp. PAMC 25486 TaxID=1494608 RepID=UPI0005362E22|nr:SDR family oxidoreductase [Arthrobacter sp. PAMC 25486]AIY02131.1 short-chain alcohol dehydrogenase like protein [Arthrobacter sp. PAMC 25486]
MESNQTRSAIVTGTSGGIGRAVAQRLAADGFAITAHYGGNRGRAEDVVDEVRAAGGQAIAVGGDAADESAMDKLFGAAEEAFGGVDVVVHTAGIMPLAPLTELDLAVFDQVQRTNVRGTAVVAQQAARRVRAGGAIVLFSTSITRLQSPGYAAYAMSKGAVEALTLVLARELRGRDVTVNTVAPGPTDTPLFREGKPAQLIETIAGLNPMGRLGTAEDIAGVVSALAGTARWVNGQVIYANGGAA